jgi:1-acyl-sn-glycerol-3-phosphate acyltransferase
MAAPDVNVPGEHLWNFTRLKPGLSGQDKLLLALWAPFGCVLSLIRLVCWPLGMIGFPIAYQLGVGQGYMRIIQLIWSVRVTINGLENLENSSAVLVMANHVSDFDACAIWAANSPADQILVVNEHWRWVIQVAQRFGWPVNPIYTTGGDTKEVLAQEVQRLSAAPGRPKRILIFPEGRTSSGMTVMPFFDFTFSLGQPVVPCAVKVRNPWPVQMQMNGTSVLCNAAALYFLPYVDYELTFFPEQSGEGKSKEDYAESVRKILLQHLDVPPTTLTAKDKVAFGKARAERAKAQ